MTDELDHDIPQRKECPKGEGKASLNLEALKKSIRLLVTCVEEIEETVTITENLNDLLNEKRARITENIVALYEYE